MNISNTEYPYTTIKNKKKKNSKAKNSEYTTVSVISCKFINCTVSFIKKKNKMEAHIVFLCRVGCAMDTRLLHYVGLATVVNC